MKRYLLKKLVTAFFIVLVVIVLNFLIIKMAPGDPVRILAGADTLTEEVIESLTIEFGLDQPLHVQLWKYISNLLHGDLGESFAYSQPVTVLIADRFFNSLLLSGTSCILAVIIGCWLGLYAGKNHGGLIDRTFSAIAYLFNSMPAFWLGMMGILLFATKLHLLPTQGMYNLRAGYKGCDGAYDSALLCGDRHSNSQLFPHYQDVGFAGHGGRLHHDLPRDGYERKEDFPQVYSEKCHSSGADGVRHQSGLRGFRFHGFGNRFFLARHRLHDVSRHYVARL